MKFQQFTSPPIEVGVLLLKLIDDNHPDTMNLSQLRADVKSIKPLDYDLIIIEGLLTLWDEKLYGLLDMKVYVDCPADQRIIRRLKRNMEWGQTFDQVSNVYIDLVRFRHLEYVENSKWKADVILNGTEINNNVVKMICHYINTCNEQY